MCQLAACESTMRSVCVGESECVRGCERVGVRGRGRERVCVCACARARACVCVCVCVCRQRTVSVLHRPRVARVSVDMAPELPYRISAHLLDLHTSSAYVTQRQSERASERARERERERERESVCVCVCECERQRSSASLIHYFGAGRKSFACTHTFAPYLAE